MMQMTKLTEVCPTDGRGRPCIQQRLVIACASYHGYAE